MCYSQAEGGQRCYGGAKERYDTALRNLRFGGDKAREEFLDAEADLASTAQGEEELFAQYEQALAANRPEEAEDLLKSIERGRDRREKNAAVKNAVKAATKKKAKPVNPLADKTPVDIDTQLYALYQREQTNLTNLSRAAVSLRHAVGDRKRGWGQNEQWGMTWEEALAAAKEKAEAGGYQARYAQQALKALEDGKAEAAKIRAEQEPLDAEFARRGGWTRAFLVTNANGHVHRDRSCSTCTPTTQYSWQTQYSGKPEEEIVAAAGSSACTVCYPSAPAEVLNRPPQMVSEQQAERDAARQQRAEAKAQRDADKIAKALTADGSEFEVVYERGVYGANHYREQERGKAWERKERFKTELSATSWAVGKIVDYSPGAWQHGKPMPEATVEAIAAIKDAIQRKHGFTDEQLEAHFAKKIKAKRKAEGLG